MTKIEQRLSPILTGITAQYLVAGELSRRGHIASITLRNTKGIDVLASNTNASKSVGIQVKGSQGRKYWLLNKSGEDYVAKSLFYVFVKLKDRDSRPDFYIVPSKVVARYVKHSHAKWLATPGRRGQKHRDTPMRVYRDDKQVFLERWDLLGL